HRPPYIAYGFCLHALFACTHRTSRFIGLCGLSGIVVILVLRRQLIGLFQQGDLFLHRGRLAILRHQHGFQFVDALPEFLLFRVLLRRLVERAQRGVQPLVGGSGSADARLSFVRRFPVGRFRPCQAVIVRSVGIVRWRVTVAVVPERGEVAHHAPAFLPLVFQILLLVGFRLVPDDFGVFGHGHVRVESLSLPFFLLV